jgi:DNA-binding Xre family transcriptional regulator
MSRPEFLSLIHTLKGCLKTRKIRYADLAKKTKLSEPTLKRLLGGNQCNIEHIFKICEAIEISFFDLASMAAADRIESYTLTEKQEEYFASDPDAYAVLCKLYDGKPLEEIRADSPLDKRSFQRVLLKLDQLGLAEVHANDQVVFKIKKQMRWLDNGPMVRKYYLQVGHEIVEESFLHRSADDVLFHVAAVDLSD